MKLWELYSKEYQKSSCKISIDRLAKSQYNTLESVSNETDKKEEPMKFSKSHEQVLEGCFIFQSLTPDERRQAYEKLTVQAFQKGEIIYSQHSFQRSLGILLEGEAAVQKESGALLNLLQSGSCFGAAALFAPAEEYVTTIIARKACKAAFISDEELAKLFRSYPDMAMAYITFLSGRIQFLNQKIDSFTTPSAEDAVYRWLQAHQDEAGKVRVSGGFARLARELNIGRASLYRSLAQLEQSGQIVKNGAEIVLLQNGGTVK